METFVQVIIPLPLPQLYTYSVPLEHIDEIGIGKRVIVEFGRKKLHSCIIAEITNEAPTSYEAKEILDIIDEHPIINPIQLKLITWISDYYMCTKGEVINASLPAGLKLNSESKIQFHPNYNPEEDHTELDSKEILILDYINEKESIRLADVSKFTGISKPHKYIKSLIQREFIVIYEEVNEKYKPKRVTKIRLTSDFLTDDALEQLISTLERKTKQLDAVMGFFTISSSFQHS